MIYFLISVAVNLILLAVFYVIVSRNFRKSGSSASYLDEVRSELSQIVIELNQTTDRNIDLIEAKIQDLKDVVETADQRIKLMNKRSVNKNRRASTDAALPPSEGQAHSSGVQLYAREHKKGQVAIDQVEYIRSDSLYLTNGFSLQENPPVDKDIQSTDIPEPESNSGSKSEKKDNSSLITAIIEEPIEEFSGQLSKEPLSDTREVLPTSDQADAAVEAYSPVNPDEQQNRMFSDNAASAASRNADTERTSGYGTTYNAFGQRTGIQTAAKETVRDEEEQAAATKGGMRKRILEMQREGTDTKLIAAKLGLPVGEVELIISLDSL